MPGALIGVAVAWHVIFGLTYWVYSAPLFVDLPFRADFEEADLREWSFIGATQLCCEHSAKVVSQPVRSGEHALKVTLDSTDRYIKGSKRAELRLKAVLLGGAYSYAFSLFVPGTWAETTDRVVFAQWHSVPDKLLFEGERAPVLKLSIVEGRFELKGTWDDDLISTTWFDNDGAAAVSDPYLWTAPFERGAWIDWVVDVHWSHDADGYLELWKDGKSVFRREGPNCFNDLLGPYFKMGVYISNWKEPDRERKSGYDRRFLYFDAVYVVNKTKLLLGGQPPR